MDWARRAHELNESGVDGLFTFEGKHDIFLPLAVASAAAPIDVMTNIAVAVPRSPLHLAHAAYDLQQLSGGRFRLGLGSQIRPHIENRYGATWSRPVARMREIVLAVREILDSWQEERSPQFVGEFTRHTLMPPTFRPAPSQHGRPPVMLGALGPLMTTAAAEVADGLLVMPFNTRRHFVERTLPAVDSGLATSGRTREQFVMVPQLITGMGRTDQEVDTAARGTRQLVAFYASTPAYRPVLEVEGYADLQPELNRLSKLGDFAAMEALIDDDLLSAIAVLGTPEQCAAQIVERFGPYARRVCAYFPGYQVSAEDLSAFVTALHAADESP
ncbi:TIGR03617 family F420-dependent LLM class oxidoreductase [Nocardioides sp. Bht2]|uniref:TIGR03617 family F420-dependent LLM class oxidoreductase n=1 Tax=Nocardioides sp. Bht2 TaxID=3392297 RepID=UPI0039B48FBA